MDAQQELAEDPERNQPLGDHVQIRWMIRRDMDEILTIERDNFGSLAWADDDFCRHLRARNVIGAVAELGNEIVGYMVYELHKTRLRILNFAVDVHSQSCGIGTRMVQRLKEKLSLQKRNEIVLEIRETNLRGQLFFANRGFVAVSVLREHFDNGEDAYQMEYCLS